MTRHFEDANPAISKDGLSLYFQSGRPGGYGGLDIYVARRTTTDLPWNAPVNLGPVASWHSDPAPIAATSSRGSIVPGSYSKPSVLLAITARRTFLAMASGSSTATSTSEISGSSIWRDKLHRGSRTVRAPRRRRRGFQMVPRSPIAPTSVACSRRMSPAPAPSGFCSPNP
jgi:WD40-like Beta Propeller Repeat